MSNSAIRPAAAANSQALSDLAPQHVRPTTATVDDIVEQALAVLDEESHDWLQDDRRRNSISEWMGPRPSSAS
jgi:hypothetical protein